MCQPNAIVEFDLLATLDVGNASFESILVLQDLPNRIHNGIGVTRPNPNGEAVVARRNAFGHERCGGCRIEWVAGERPPTGFPEFVLNGDDRPGWPDP